MECALRPVTEPVLEAAREAAQNLAAVEAPLLALSRHLEDILDDESAELDGSSRARIEGALRGLDRRARMTLPGWRSMLAALEVTSDEPDPDFVDWLSAEAAFGRIHDVALRRHWIDPTVPLEAAVIMPSHGVLVTSATLSDPMSEDPFDMARMRTGSARLIEPARTLKVESPFDYAGQQPGHRRQRPDQGRHAPDGGGDARTVPGGGRRRLGLFTAIRRLKAVYERLGPGPRQGRHAPLRPARRSAGGRGAGRCVPGRTGQLPAGHRRGRDGVDVPGRSLRILAFDRVPWPRPDLLHKARRREVRRIESAPAAPMTTPSPAPGWRRPSAA
jgi:ATP-dependent DNA helicase DinG